MMDIVWFVLKSLGVSILTLIICAILFVLLEFLTRPWRRMKHIDNLLYGSLDEDSKAATIKYVEDLEYKMKYDYFELYDLLQQKQDKRKPRKKK